MIKKPWTRNQKLLLIGIIISAGLSIASIVMGLNNKTKVDLLEIKAKEMEANVFCLPNGYCLFEDSLTTIPNMTMGYKDDHNCSMYFGATTTIDCK